MIFMKAQLLKSKFREYQIKYYQFIADSYISVLRYAQQANDNRLFEIIYQKAINFNGNCVEKGIYLD